MPFAPDVIGLTVRDMATTLSFYRSLGMAIPTEADTEPHVDVLLAGGIRLSFDTEEVIASFDPSFSPGGGGRMSLAFRCADAQEVNTRYADMTVAGFAGHLEPFDAFWGQRYAVLHDPDGTTVDLYAALTTGSD